MDFRNLLANYFTKDVVNLILEENKLQIVKDVKQKLEKLDKENIEIKKCESCPLTNQNKKMDFPAWLGELDPKKSTKKDVMIIGVSPNKLILQVQIAYGLGYDYFSEKDLEVLNSGARKFWKKLYVLFNNDKEYLHNNIYITDIAFCDCESGDEETLKFCSEGRIMKEIEFINPKLLIIHGFLIKKLIKTFPRPTIYIPHIQGRGIRHYPPEHQIWCEAKNFIQKILNH